MWVKAALATLLVSAILAREDKVLPADDCFGLHAHSCQNFDVDRQDAINKQINKELEASYVYMAMSTYFSRSEPNHPGFSKFFAGASVDEREHALKLAEYLNSRGGEVTYTNITAPTKHTWAHGLAAFKDALDLEKDVNEKLLALHAVADADPHMQDFLETHYLNEQVDSINEINGFISQLKRLHKYNAELGEFNFEQRFL